MMINNAKSTLQATSYQTLCVQLNIVISFHLISLSKFCLAISKLRFELCLIVPNNC